MDKKRDKEKTKESLSSKEKEVQRLMEEHPYETMSQVQNRYGQGREHNGSEGSEQNAKRLSH